MNGPCLCGDPECGRCFPQPYGGPDDSQGDSPTAAEFVEPATRQQACKHCGRDRKSHGRQSARCPNPIGKTWTTFEPSDAPTLPACAECGRPCSDPSGTHPSCASFRAHIQAGGTLD